LAFGLIAYALSLSPRTAGLGRPGRWSGARPGRGRGPGAPGRARSARRPARPDARV